MRPWRSRRRCDNDCHRHRRDPGYVVISRTGVEDEQAMNAAGFARRPDGGWVFVGIRVAEGQTAEDLHLTPGFELVDGVIRHTGQ